MATLLQSLQFFLLQATVAVSAMEIDMLPRAIQHLQHLCSHYDGALLYFQYLGWCKKTGRMSPCFRKRCAFMKLLPVVWKQHKNLSATRHKDVSLYVLLGEHSDKNESQILRISHADLNTKQLTRMIVTARCPSVCKCLSNIS